MSEAGGFSIDQLMELAGLSVSQAGSKYIHHVREFGAHRRKSTKSILPQKVEISSLLVARAITVSFSTTAPPSFQPLLNHLTRTGGDGLVCARHLHHYGYTPTIYYPKPSKPDLFTRLQTQLHTLHIPFTTDFPGSLATTDLLIDALFGFSFRPPVRKPFDKIIPLIEKTDKPVLAVDIPSCWNVDGGPPAEGELGAKFMPEYLISLTAAKPCVRFFRGQKHFIGGRFLAKDVAEKFGLDVPEYQGIDQIVEVPVDVKAEKL
jgi:NAD(P)H-hydrate epimerase